MQATPELTALITILILVILQQLSGGIICWAAKYFQTHRLSIMIIILA